MTTRQGRSLHSWMVDDPIMSPRHFFCCRLLALVCLSRFRGTESWVPADRTRCKGSYPLQVEAMRPGVCVRAGKSDDEKAESLNPLTKASWYAVEAFGKVFGSATRDQTDDSTAVVAYSLDSAPTSLDETLARIQADNQREYFLSGRVDELIYDPDCVFADPFVEFRGRDRFVENLQNLGSFIAEYSARPLSYEIDGNAVETKFMVKLRLNLPWKPVLAWPWGVRCEVDEETNLVVLHKETWDIDPWEGVKQIFRKSTLKSI